MNEIIVKTQEELDNVPMDYHGRIIIKFGTWLNPAILRKSYDNASAVLRGNARAVLWDNASAVLWDNASAVLRDNASAVLWDNASAVLRGNARAELRGNARAVLRGNARAELRGNARAVLWDNASAELRDNARAELRDNASAVLWDNASAVLWDNASAVLWDNASAVLWGNASAVLWDNASAVLWGNASAELRGNARAELWDNASAELRDNARAEASGNAQIVDVNRSGHASISENARVVYLPQNLEEFISHYGVQSDDVKVTLYKAVHKEKGHYYSDYDTEYEYRIGEIAVPDNGFDGDVSEKCGAGINMAPLHWCLNYGREWDDIAILEMTALREDVVVPMNTDGKVRARKAKVIREVPLSECGIYGEILAKRRGDSND